MGILLVVPSSILTIRVFPAVNRSTDYIHAVKMGYPAFWIVILVAAAVGLSASRDPGRGRIRRGP